MNLDSSVTAVITGGASGLGASTARGIGETRCKGRAF